MYSLNPIAPILVNDVMIGHKCQLNWDDVLLLARTPPTDRHAVTPNRVRQSAGCKARASFPPIATAALLAADILLC
jgi:hypothetical protein